LSSNRDGLRETQRAVTEGRAELDSNLILKRAREGVHLRRPSVVVIALLLSLTAIPKLTPAQTSNDRNVRQLEKLETVWNDAQMRGDTQALDALWADDMEIAVPRMPIMTKAEALSFARSGRMKFLRYETSDIRVRVYGNAAVVTGRLQRTREMNGKEISDDWRFTKVYVRRTHQWRVVAFHASEAAPSA
jgi:ketosteroid isomerase-like protein